MNILKASVVTSIFATSAMAQDAPPIGSPFYDIPTDTYVDDPINKVTDLAGTLTCVLNKGGFNHREFVNSSWKSIQPESECFDANWTGNVKILFDSQRLSNESPRELVAWMEIDTLNAMGNMGNYVMTLTQTEGENTAPPFGIFEMKFYQANITTPTVVPASPLDTALVKTEKTSDGAIKLTTLRNNRMQQKFLRSASIYRQGAQDITVSAESNNQRQNINQKYIGVADENYFRQSNPDGTSAVCKSRDIFYNNSWNNRLYTASGEPVQLENGNISFELLNNGGNAWVSTKNYWFKTEQISTPTNNFVQANIANTNTLIDLVWAPGELSRYVPGSYTITRNDTFQFTQDQHKATFDGTGFLLDDQTINPASYPNDLVSVPSSVQNDPPKIYVAVHPETGRGTWHPSMDVGLTFFRSNPNQSWSVNPSAILQFSAPLTTKDPLLSSSSATPMVCVSDWRCPHITDYNYTGFGANTPISVYKTGNVINISENSTKYNELFKPNTEPANNNSATNFNDHHYLVTPLDVTDRTQFPQGTLPASVYYDLNKNGLLEATEQPIMTLLREKKDGTWVYNGRDLLSSEVGTITNFGFYFDLVTKEDWQNGCDNKITDQAGNVTGFDNSFFMCENRVRYKTETNASGGRYYPRDASGKFIFQQAPLAVTYTTDKEHDLNNGFNGKITNPASKIAKVYNKGSQRYVYNKVTGEKCTDANGCRVELGPEAIHNTKKLFTHDGQEFYPLPGDKFRFPDDPVSVNNQPYEGKFYPSMNLKDSTKVYDFFDPSKFYFVKNLGISQRLLQVPDSECVTAGITFNNENDPAFNGITQAELPSVNIDSQLRDMPKWLDPVGVSDRQLVEQRATSLVCSVNNGIIVETCNFN